MSRVSSYLSVHGDVGPSLKSCTALMRNVLGLHLLKGRLSSKNVKNVIICKYC